MGGDGPSLAAYAHELRVYVRRTADCVLLLTVHGSSPIALRGTALAVWDAFAAPRSIDEVAQELATVYDVPLDSVRAEVMPLVQALHRDGLLVARPEPDER